MSFDDLISLIKFTLDSQIKINNSLKVKDDLSKIAQDFINNLSYYIFSYEKFDINKNNGSYHNINNNTYNNNTYTNLNINSNNKKKKKQKNQEQSITPSAANRNKKKIENKKDEEGFQDISRNKKKQKNEIFQNRKSFYKSNINNKILLTKNNNNSKIIDKKDNLNKHFLNKSMDKRNNSIISDLSINNNENNNKKRKTNKSAEKRKLTKKENQERNNTNPKNDNKNSLSIFTACEYLRGSNYLLRSTKSRGWAEANKNKNNIDNYTTKSYEDRKKETPKDDIKMIHFSENKSLGIKIKKINKNIIKPSNMANKLLITGIKYITDFKDLKEEENKKKY